MKNATIAMAPTMNSDATQVEEGSLRSPECMHRGDGKPAGRESGKRTRPTAKERRGDQTLRISERDTVRHRKSGRVPEEGPDYAPHMVVNKGKAPINIQDGKEAQPEIKRFNLLPSEDHEAEVSTCFICASPTQHIAVAPCNHRTCHICCIRMRALYKTKACAHCRTESDYVVFTDNTSKNFEQFTQSDFIKSDKILGIHFENDVTFDDALSLLRYNCPDGNCEIACLGWPDLLRHVKMIHHKLMCDLCTSYKKVFTHEHELFTAVELRKHTRYGNDQPGTADQSGFKGHPECGFCSQRFYGDDELYRHCRDKHERCHICDRCDGNRQQQYFLDYTSLERHFEKEHFLCPQRECLDKKFVVFDSEMDLKAHNLDIHPNSLSKDALRETRKIHISSFDYRTSRTQETVNRGKKELTRETRNQQSRDQDGNLVPIPSPLSRHMSRAELAYQRQIQAETSRSSTGRPFGGQPNPTHVTLHGLSTRILTTAPKFNNVSSAFPDSKFPQGLAQQLQPLNRPQRSNEMREKLELDTQNAFAQRALAMLRNDEMKFLEFQDHLSAYYASKLSATQLIEELFKLFGGNTCSMDKLMHELMNLNELKDEKNDLLRAWNDLKVTMKGFPALPSLANKLEGNNKSHGRTGFGKINKLSSHSSSMSMSGTFATTLAASTGGVRTKSSNTPRDSSSQVESNIAMPITSRSDHPVKRRIKTDLTEAFPPLPAASTPSSSKFSPGYKGLAVKRENNSHGVTVSNVWSSSLNPVESVKPNWGEQVDSNNNKKTRQKKGKTILHWG